MYLVPVYDPKHLNYLSKIELPSGSSIEIAFLFDAGDKELLPVDLHEHYSVTVIPNNEIVNLVDQTEVSRKCTEIVSKLVFSGDIGRKAFILSNMHSLSIHPIVNMLCMIEKLCVKKKYTKVLTFGCRGSFFDFPERVDVKSFYQPETSKTTLINEWLNEEKIPYQKIAIKPILRVYFAHVFRRLLLNLYKFFVISSRKIKLINRSKRPIYPKGPKKIGVLVRAQSEYWTVKPLLEFMKKNGSEPLLIQDDLIKNPSCKKTLDVETEDYVPIHSVIGFYKLVHIWILSSCKFFFSSIFFSKNVEIKNPNSSLERVLLNRKNVKHWISSTLHSLPELSVFEYEIKKIITDYSLDCLVTMDMVDQWSAILGEIGKNLGIKTLIIQNTVLDKIIYPIPVATDFIAVSGPEVKALLNNSAPVNSRTLDFGLPIHDDIFRRYTPHSGQLENTFTIVVATQPFVQDYDYNMNLIVDVISAFEDLFFKVNIILKPHPRENISLYKKLINVLNVPNKIKFSLSSVDNILDLADKCDLFISRTSTAIQTFILLGRVTVSYLNEYPKDVSNRIDYLSCSACQNIANKKELFSLARNLESSYSEIFNDFLKHRSSYIKHHIGTFDGEATQRIYDFLLR